jgi:hypothetical protein
MNLNRRAFMATASLATTEGALNQALAQSAGDAPPVGTRPLIVSTWRFGKPGNERALAVIENGGSTLDAVEEGIRLVEAAGISSVGLTSPTRPDMCSSTPASYTGPVIARGASRALRGSCIRSRPPAASWKRRRT